METLPPAERNTAIVAAIGRGVSLRTVCAIFSIDALTVRHAVESAGQSMPVEPPGPDVVIANRESEMLRRALDGEDFSVISRAFDVSREWVRQVVKKHTGLSAKDLKEARDAARHQFKVQQAHDLASADADFHLDELARRSGLSVREVESLFGSAESARRRRAKIVTTATERDHALGGIRGVASLDGGTPLSGPFYDSHRNDGLSSARLIQIFGSWSAACEEAGVEARRAPRGEYSRSWTREDCLHWVRSYLNDVESPTFEGYDAWARQQGGAPSSGTVRLRCGKWIETIRDAYELEAGKFPDPIGKPVAVTGSETESPSASLITHSEPRGESDPSNIPDIPPSMSGQGFQHELDVRLKVETAAQERLMDDFRSRGWQVADTHLGHPYDAVATKDDRVLFLEAKGTQSAGAAVLVTRGEVAHAQAYPGQCFMGIWSGIQFDERGNVHPDSGNFRVLPFDPGTGQLTVITYEWTPCESRQSASGELKERASRLST
ncbi:hypothetical protein BS618_26195 [Rhodococcus erythropolis]|uniref:protein NO VEIN domain-containing protein n=1 Tax=Rhodococcus sp. PvP104 TaxID=2817911 RepID=UPI0009371DA6|nr:DUF3883 domain-containing protein [Rhodococcus sp. PvP104]OKA11905.1 hypothetical protein BS618_26195 [Rhodococcus erythropolis]